MMRRRKMMIGFHDIDYRRVIVIVGTEVVNLHGRNMRIELVAVL
jgi:hypothetical protein